MDTLLDFGITLTAIFLLVRLVFLNLRTDVINFMAGD